MKSTITNAAEITVLEPIDRNFKTGGGDISVGGAMVVAKKGKPFSPMKVYGGTSNLQDYFGTPLPKKADGMEGLRHVHDAAEECSFVQTVRVVGTGYRFPALGFLLAKETGDAWAEGKEYAAGDVVSVGGAKWLCAYAHTSAADNAPKVSHEGSDGGNWLTYLGPVTHSAHRYNEDAMVGEGCFMLLYPTDGAESKNRTVTISNVDSVSQRLTISIYDKDDMGEAYMLESHTVGINEDNKDDMGLSAYVETIFERNSSRFRCDFMEGTEWDTIEPTLKAIETTRTTAHSFAFMGGTSGGIPDVADWQIGVNVFRNESLPLNLLFAAGIYEPDVLVALASIADDRHIAFFYDLPAHLKHEEAMEWDRDMSLISRHARAYYAPFAANDQWRGGKAVWGVSGAMAAAKARCNKIVTVGSTPGVHYAPAGEGRAYLSRTGLKALFPDDVINRDMLYDARINPIVPINSGGCAGDDDMTHWFKSNYLRFGWINDVLDYIDHRFYEAARQVKFEPDGLTRQGLYDMTKGILDNLVTSGALVVPRDPERDGLKPYTITIEQLEIDLWKVTWDVCITGSSRRIAGQPALIK